MKEDREQTTVNECLPLAEIDKEQAIRRAYLLGYSAGLDRAREISKEVYSGGRIEPLSDQVHDKGIVSDLKSQYPMVDTLEKLDKIFEEENEK